MPSFFANLFSGLGNALASIGHSPVASALEAELPAVIAGIVDPAIARTEAALNASIVALEARVAVLEAHFLPAGVSTPSTPQG